MQSHHRPLTFLIWQQIFPANCQQKTSRVGGFFTVNAPVLATFNRCSSVRDWLQALPVDSKQNYVGCLPTTTNIQLMQPETAAPRFGSKRYQQIFNRKPSGLPVFFHNKYIVITTFNRCSDVCDWFRALPVDS
jgi:hypothetical protein